MKNVTITGAAILVLSIVLFTGFQCGSAEVTSAKLYLQRNDFVNAEKALMKEVEKNPENAEAWFLLGQTRASMGNHRGALQAVDRSLTLSKEFESNIMEVKRYSWAQSLNRGVDRYNKSVKAPPDSAQSLRRQAVEEYQTAIDIFPDSAISYQNIAVAYLALGEHDKQIENLKKFLAKRNDPEARILLINAYLQKAQGEKTAGRDANTYYELAIRELTEARKSDPDNQELLGTLINIYIEVGRAQEAFPFIEEAVAKDPTNAVFQNDLGLLLMETNKTEEAILHFNAAIDADPAFPDPLRNGAVAYLKLGQKKKEEASAPADSKSSQSLNRAYLEDFKKAVNYLERLIKIPPQDKDPNVWDALASAYVNAGMIPEAMKATEKADNLRKGN